MTEWRHGMAGRLGIAAVACAAVVGTAEAAERIELSWLAMAETCMVYAESGERALAFGGWHVAAEGGGVCNGDPVCESDQMTFVGAGDLGLAAVTVSVGAADWAVRAAEPQDASIGDRPAHVTCASAIGTRHRTRDIVDVHAAWVGSARESGRLVEGGVFAGLLSGPYLGCGHDGRPYQIEFALQRDGAAAMRLYFPAREGGAEGTGPDCVRVVS